MLFLIFLLNPLLVFNANLTSQLYSLFISLTITCNCKEIYGIFFATSQVLLRHPGGHPQGQRPEFGAELPGATTGCGGAEIPCRSHGDDLPPNGPHGRQDRSQDHGRPQDLRRLVLPGQEALRQGDHGPGQGVRETAHGERQGTRGDEPHC